MIEAKTIEKIITNIARIKTATRETANSGLQLAKHAADYIAQHPAIIWALLGITLGTLTAVAIYKIHKTHKTYIRDALVATTLLATTIIAITGNTNTENIETGAYLQNQETTSHNTLQAAANYAGYETHARCLVIYWKGKLIKWDKNWLIWIKNNSTDTTTTIENIQIEPAYPWIKKTWSAAGPLGLIHKTTLGPGEKAYIWMQVDFTKAPKHGDYKLNVTVTISGENVTETVKHCVIIQLKKP